MLKLGTQETMFLVGCFLGVQLWNMCNQIILLSLCLLVLSALLLKAGSEQEAVEAEFLQPATPGPRLAVTPTATRVFIGPGVDSSPAGSTSTDATAVGPVHPQVAQVNQWISNLPRTRKAHHQRPDRPDPTKAKQTAGEQVNPRHTTTESSASTSPTSKLESVRLMLFKGTPEARQVQRHVAFMSKAKREAVLAWIQDAHRAETHDFAPRLSPLESVAGFVLPLNAQRLAQHDKKHTGCLAPCSSCFDLPTSSPSAGYSSYFSDVQGSRDERESVHVPVKRASASVDSVEWIATPSPRRPKLKKEEAASGPTSAVLRAVQMLQPRSSREDATETTDGKAAGSQRMVGGQVKMKQDEPVINVHQLQTFGVGLVGNIDRRQKDRDEAHIERMLGGRVEQSADLNLFTDVSPTQKQHEGQQLAGVPQDRQGRVTPPVEPVTHAAESTANRLLNLAAQLNA